MANLVFCRAADMTNIVARLREQDIWIRGFTGAFADCARVTVGTPEENARLLAALQKLR